MGNFSDNKCIMKGEGAMIKTVGSICSGIEAASVAWKPLGLNFEWFSEIAPFPSKVLREKFPEIKNMGDMNNIPQALVEESICAPDLICGGTPCQAFSLAGGKKGLNDERGNLTLKFVDIIEANDKVRERKNQDPCTVFWENVEGVLTDKTNAFGCLISSLAGLDVEVSMKKWPSAGLLKGKKRNVAWRVLDAKYFGLPQQRRRLYVLAGGKTFHPEEVLFEMHNKEFVEYPSESLVFEKDGHSFETFREYADCLYSAYGTKWNGNAAAYNGSLFVVQDQKIRRFSPLECERLMGFPDDYTNIKGAKRTNRYQAIGNSWAVPVVQWIGKRLISPNAAETINVDREVFSDSTIIHKYQDAVLYDFSKGIIETKNKIKINCTERPEESVFKTLKDIVSGDAPKEIYISPVGCYGIIRRKYERNIKINESLEKALLRVAGEMTEEEIEKKSRIQPRGKYSKDIKKAYA